jgi:small-conductance mechanosensitive channel
MPVALLILLLSVVLRRVIHNGLSMLVPEELYFRKGMSAKISALKLI